MRIPKRPSPRRRSRLFRQSSALTILAAVLGVLAVVAALITTYVVTNPDAAYALLANRPTATLFVMNPTATVDPRETLPPTWTPTRTPGSPPSPTASATPTRTLTPTATTTRIPTLTFTPYATVPVGWYEFKAPNAQLAIQMPNTWSGVELVGTDPTATLVDISQRDPVLAASLEDGMTHVVIDNLVIIAFDTATSNDPYVVNLNIAYANTAEGDTIDAIRDLHLTLYGNSEFYELLANDSTTVDFRPAHRIRYTTPFEGAEGRTTVYHLEVISEGRRSDNPILVMTLSTSRERRNIYEALLDRIAASIRFTR